MRNRQRLLFSFIFALAFLIRLIFVWQWRHLPYAQTPYLDALAYDSWARSISEGHWLRSTAFYQSPLYPYLLGWLYRFCGHDLFLVSLLQTLMDAITCTLLSVVASRSFGNRAALCTGVLAAFYAPMIFFCAPVMKESLGLFCLSAFLYLWQRAENAALARKFLWAGLALGLAALCRSNALLLGLAAAVYLALVWKRQAVRGLIWFSAGVLLTIAPVTLHNWVAAQDFVLINYGGGFNFYVGHSPDATGGNSYPPEVSTDPTQEEADTVRLATSESGHTLKPSEVSQYWFAKGLSTALANPSGELALLLNKTMLFWNSFEAPDNYDQGFIRAQFQTLLSWPLVSFATLALLAGLGASLSWQKPSSRFLSWLAFSYFCSVAMFYVTDRYRLPVVIFLLPLAGTALPSLISVIQRRHWKAAFAASIVGLLLSWLGFRQLSDTHSLDSYNFGLVASLYADAGNDLRATEFIEKALATKPLGVTAQALIKSADSYERLGRLDQAEKLLDTAVDIYPKDGLTYHNLGRFFHEHGKFHDARQAFLKSIEVAPWNYQPYVGLALTSIKLKEFGEAAWAVQQGERVAADQYDWQALSRLLETGAH